MADSDYTDDGVLVAALRAATRTPSRGCSTAIRRRCDGWRAAYVSSDAAADEVVSEAWLAVITGIDRFEQRSSLKTWIHRIVMNIARTKGSREHRSVPFSSLAAEADAPEAAVDPGRFLPKGTPGAGGWASPPVPWDEEPETRLSASETLAVVRAAIAELPPGQQMVITLRDLEGWRADEVCNTLDLAGDEPAGAAAPGGAKVRTARRSFRGARPMMLRWFRRRSAELVCIEFVEIVTDYLDGALPVPERERFERHFDACPHCRAGTSRSCARRSRWRVGSRSRTSTRSSPWRATSCWPQLSADLTHQLIDALGRLRRGGDGDSEGAAPDEDRPAVSDIPVPPGTS